MNKQILLARTALAAAMAFVLVPEVQAAGTAAGSNIVNTASASFTDPGGTSQTANSNTSTLQVDEILDVTIASNDAGNVSVNTPSTNRVLSFTITNTGNGSEAFVLGATGVVSGDQFNPSNVRIYLDNGDGVFDIATDTLYVAGSGGASGDPTLAADGTRTVFLVSDISSGLSNGDIGLATLTTTAKTGTGTAGTTFAGQGTNGSDAVVGSTTATASRSNGYAVTHAGATLAKSSTVLDQFGGANAIPGATITYTLTFTATGSGNLTNAAVTDSVPAGTTYVAGSTKLDTVALTDAAGDDAGKFDAAPAGANAKGLVTVSLGTVAAAAAPGTVHTVTFKVTID
ncbi:MAG: hypothetical protein REI12_05815 [Pedobacter sp.]|nr:hypothetical protein [Pedobacter sp.]